MTFTDAFFEIFNKLLDQIGIVVDWTATNAVPYVTDLAQRVVYFDTFQHILWMVGCIIPIIFLAYFIRKIVKADEDWWMDVQMVFVIFMAGGIILCVVGLFTNGAAIAQNILVPEITIMEMLQGVMN